MDRRVFFGVAASALAVPSLGGEVSLGNVMKTPWELHALEQEAIDAPKVMELIGRINAIPGWKAVYEKRSIEGFRLGPSSDLRNRFKCCWPKIEHMGVSHEGVEYVRRIDIYWIGDQKINARVTVKPGWLTLYFKPRAHAIQLN